MIFAFLFGLSMDYEVFIISRIREEYDDIGDTSGGDLEGIARTGKLVTSAALVLVFAFFALSPGPGPDIKQFGIGLARRDPDRRDADPLRARAVVHAGDGRGELVVPAGGRTDPVREAAADARSPDAARARETSGCGRGDLAGDDRGVLADARRAATTCACAGSGRRRSRGPARPCSRRPRARGKPSGSNAPGTSHPARVVGPEAAGEDDRADAARGRALGASCGRRVGLGQVGPRHRRARPRDSSTSSRNSR